MSAVQTSWPAHPARLKPSVYLGASSDGVQFDAGTRRFSLKGAGLLPLAQRVVAALDQGLTLAQLQQQLPERLHATVEALLEALRSHQMLLEGDSAALLASSKALPLATQEWLRAVLDQLPLAAATPRWQAWRQARVRLVGDGFALRAAAHALRDAGAGVLELAAQDSPRLSAAALHAELAAEPAGGSLDGLALLVWASDEESRLPEARRLAAEAHAAGLPAVFALRVQGRLLVAPALEPGVRMNAVEALLTALPREPEASAHSPASLALLGAVAAQTALDLHFKIQPEQWRWQARAISDQLLFSSHPVVGRRGAQAGAVNAGLQLPTDRSVSAYEQLRLDLRPWFDPLTGVFATPAEAAPQLPLAHEAVQLRDGALHLGWGLSAEDAGRRTLQAALADWAAVQLALPLSAGFEPEAVRAQAWAEALTRRKAFAAVRRAAWLNLETVSDARAQLLLQLLPQPASVQALLSWHPSQAASQVELFVADQLRARCVAATPLLALQDALGSAVSAVQRGLAALPAAVLPQAKQFEPSPPLAQATGPWPAAAAHWTPFEAPDLPASIALAHATVNEALL